MRGKKITHKKRQGSLVELSGHDAGLTLSEGQHGERDKRRLSRSISDCRSGLRKVWPACEYLISAGAGSFRISTRLLAGWEVPVVSLAVT